MKKLIFFSIEIVGNNRRKMLMFTEENNKMENIKPTPKQINFDAIRSGRQIFNNSEVYDAIKSSDNTKFDSLINKNEYDRLLIEVNRTSGEFLEECRNSDILCRTAAGRISKQASRQGTKDEDAQLEICGLISKNLGISISNLNNKAYRPTKNGRIISHEEMKKESISKDMCWKSFDGRIEGNLKGWIFAKVVFSSGGHQDNVFEEADILCNWVLTYMQECSELFVILIDTNLTEKLNVIKNKYTTTKNLLIVNHFDFQTYLIDNYYKESI